jgi:hypothetical protein
MKKSKVLWSAILSSMLLLAACGSDEEASSEKKDSKPKTEKTSTKEDKVEEKEEASSDVLNPTIEEKSQGNIEVVYTNKDPKYIHDMEGFKVSVEEYQIVKVTDMSPDFAIPFDDQTEGYVVTAKVTLDNTTGKAMYYNNNYRIQVSSELDYIPNDSNNTFVKEEDKVKSKKETEVSKYANGEKVTGLVTFTLTNQEFKSLSSVKPKFIIEGGVADNKQYKGSFQENAIFDFAYSEEQKQQAEGESNLYPDKLTTDNLADKKMIFEKSGINETQKLGDVNVTLEGVQYTEVTPTAANVERFSNFGDNGIVALTVKLKLDNQSDAPISIWNIGSKVRIDEDRGSVISAGMVEPSSPKEIKAGEQGEKYHVFLFRKDEFELFKKFNLEFGPFVGADGKGLFKNKTVTFHLPR